MTDSVTVPNWLSTKVQSITSEVVFIRFSDVPASTCPLNVVSWMKSSPTLLTKLFPQPMKLRFLIYRNFLNQFKGKCEHDHDSHLIRILELLERISKNLMFVRERFVCKLCFPGSKIKLVLIVLMWLAANSDRVRHGCTSDFATQQSLSLTLL